MIFPRARQQPLTASGYSRTDIGVYVIGQDATYLYGEDATTGNWVRSVDGFTWTSLGRAPATDFGTGHRVIELVFAGGVMFALAVTSDANGNNSGTAKLWRAPLGDWATWTDVTPTDWPVDTRGRPSIVHYNGTHLFVGNYGFYTPGVGKVWRTDPATISWSLVLNVTSGVRHIHAIRSHPDNPAHIYATAGDDPGSPRGLYRSTDGGSQFSLVASNEYPIDFTFLNDGSFVGDGDGLNRPHVVHLPTNALAGGTFRSLVWPNTNPTDGQGSWRGTTRAIFNVDGDLFYITTSESGAVGSRDGIWMARSGRPWRTVLLEELSTTPWTAAVGRIGKTYRVGGYLFTTRSRITVPTLR